MTSKPAYQPTPEQIESFTALDVGQHSPGTILHDFGVILDIVGNKGMPVSASSHFFPLNQLETINRSLAHPIELSSKRPVQKSFPHINGLYLLLRASGLSFIGSDGKKPILRLDSQAMDSWRGLNPTERYFELLKTWWVRATEEILGERGERDFFCLAIPFIDQILKAGVLTYQKPEDAGLLRYYPSHHHLGLMELFGLLEIRLMPPALAKGWLPAEIRLTEWGKVLLLSYIQFGNGFLPGPDGLMIVSPYLLEPEYEGVFSQWSRILRAYIPAWRREFSITPAAFLPGPHVFRVSLESACWRRIALPGQTSFEEFASAILESVDFDEDHLYEFRYKDRFGRSVEIVHADMDGYPGTFADEVKIGDIPLYPGMSMLFRFDFGDDWKFDILVEQVNAQLEIEQPALLDLGGEAPRQYPYEEEPDWDEEEEE